ncbi:hypothetical protein GOODEAATRI_029291, partial [Goodea atripinnis]
GGMFVFRAMCVSQDYSSWSKSLSVSLTILVCRGIRSLNLTIRLRAKGSIRGMLALRSGASRSPNPEAAGDLPLELCMSDSSFSHKSVFSFLRQQHFAPLTPV